MEVVQDFDDQLGSEDHIARRTGRQRLCLGHVRARYGLVRDLHQSTSYGVQPFSIAVDARRNPVTIEAPSLVKPGQDVTFRYRTERPSRLGVVRGR